MQLPVDRTDGVMSNHSNGQTKSKEQMDERLIMHSICKSPYFKICALFVNYTMYISRSYKLNNNLGTPTLHTVSDVIINAAQIIYKFFFLLNVFECFRI